MRSWTSPAVPSLPAPASSVPDALSLWDTRTQQLTPIRGSQGQVRLYVCGITPYDATHLGHAFTYLTFDMAQRVWRDLGLQVRYVQNVTDVDDPLLERAEQTGRDWREIADEQTELFRTDMTALRVLAPEHWQAVSDGMEDVWREVQKLAELGLAYQVDDDDADWYFAVTQVPGFGEIAHLDAESQYEQFKAKGGDPDRPGKRHPLDPLIWRMERPGEPAWDSPIGRGRPGWHIECTTIAEAFLGGDIDVQGGGCDLAFPHHEMCAALGAAHGVPFAQHYVHSAMVALDGQKMSKSLGNLELVSRLRARGVEPAVIRLALLDHHYRSDWEWFADAIDQASARLQTWREALASEHPAEALPVIDQMRTALRTDLDVPAAMRVVDDWAARTLEGDGSSEASYEASLMRAALDALLGIAA